MKKLLLSLLFCKLSYTATIKPYITILSQGIRSTLTNEAAGGPREVHASLCRGLKRLKIPYNYNPKHIDEVTTIAHAAASATGLAQMIALKKEGRIQILVAGPNYYPEGLALSSEIDIFLIPAEQTKDIWLAKQPHLKNLYIWPAGVNEDFWKPSRAKNTGRRVLVYEKKVEEYILINTIDILKKHNWVPIIIKYGSYDHESFKSALNTSRFAVFLSKYESQGLALAEAWSMNIPTFCYEPKIKVPTLPDIDLYFSSCPLLTKQTGKTWKTFSDLEWLILSFESSEQQFTPRRWILKNLTDTICAQRLLNIIEQVKLKKQSNKNN